LGGRAIVCSDNAVLIDIKENHLPQKLKSYHGRTRNTTSLISARQRLIFAITKLESSISPHAIALGWGGGLSIIDPHNEYHQKHTNPYIYLTFKQLLPTITGLKQAPVISSINQRTVFRRSEYAESLICQSDREEPVFSIKNRNKFGRNTVL
jgi:hypothetical protein